MSEIRAFNSHIEVYPYEKGDCESLEKRLSKYDPIRHGYTPVAFYIQNDILYLPRGTNLSMLQGYFNTTPTIVNKSDDCVKISKGVMQYKPKNRIQEDALKFLEAKDEFAKSNFYSQLGLNLDTGDGKTFCMASAILYWKKRAIVITHKERVKSQWINTFVEMTSVDKDRLCDISGSNVIDAIMKGNIIADIYFVNHQTISSYARAHGWSSIRDFFRKIKVGIKVIDEAHKFFENSLMIDYFSNVEKSYYLTATFGRSDPGEVAVYKRAYGSMYRFGEETNDYEEKRKHIIMCVILYQSRPSGMVNVQTPHGFSSYKFIDYALNEEENTLMRVLAKILDNIDNLEGKTLVTSPKIASVETIAEKMRDYTTKTVGVVHSKNGKKGNEIGISSDIISSTIKSIGEGDDIKGLRCVINLEPVASKSLASQLRGRLREFSPDKDTFLFYPVDTSIPDCYKMLNRILPEMKRKCKEIKIMKWDM